MYTLFSLCDRLQNLFLCQIEKRLFMNNYLKILTISSLFLSNLSYASSGSTEAQLACEVKCKSPKLTGVLNIDLENNAGIPDAYLIEGIWEENTFVVSGLTYFSVAYFCKENVRYVVANTFGKDFNLKHFDFNECTTRPLVTGSLGWFKYKIEPEVSVVDEEL
jgi:hypothetical protein